jgi:hypothetical protein
MKRLQTLSRQRRPLVRTALLSLVVLALLAFTLHSLASSGASFAVGSVNPANVFVAGSLLHTNTKSGQVVLTADDLEPGMTSQGTMTLKGTGNVTGAFTLNASSLVNWPISPELSDALDLTIEDITGTPDTLYDDSVSGFTSADLGDIAPGAVRTYRITLEYPAGPNDAALQGATMTLALQVLGVAP